MNADTINTSAPDHDHDSSPTDVIMGNIGALKKSGIVPWHRWLQRMGARWGFAFLMCGLACFLAANWSTMSNPLRLGVMQAGLTAFVLLGMVSRGRKHFSSLCLLGAGMMVGAFWIVFSQIYQTGADSWQLFALWAVGVLPWLLLNPSVSLWLLLLILSNIGLALWSMQNGQFYWRELGLPALYCLLFNSVLWLACVYMEWRAWRRHQGPLLRITRRWGLAVLPFLLGWATLESCIWLLQAAFFESWARLTWVGIMPLAVLVVVGLYERITRRVGPFSLLALCGFPLLNCALALMVEDGDAGLLLFLYGSANLGYTALVLHTLAALRHVPCAEAEEDCETPLNPQQAWKSRQKDRTRQATQQVGQGITHVLASLGGLLSSTFLIAFAVYSFYDTSDPVGFALVMAVIFLCVGLLCARIPLHLGKQTSFFRTLALCLSLCGWFFLIAATWLYWHSPRMGLVLLPVTALLYVLHPQPVWRFLSVGSALTALMLTLLWRGSNSESSSFMALCILCACALPLYTLAVWGKWRPRWLTPKREKACLPCLYAMLGVLLVFLPFWGWLNMLLPGARYWLENWSLVLLAIPVMGLVILLLRQCIYSGGKPFWHTALYRIVVAIVGLAVLYFLIHHMARSFFLVLLVPLLGHACRLRLMERVGWILLGVFLVLHYYSWQVPFLDKAHNMVVAGFVMLAVAMALGLWRRYKRRQKVLFQASPQVCLSPPRFLRVAWHGAALLALGLTLASFLYAIQNREKILEHGDTVLLTLAPVDPLSLVQGYYMALAYKSDRDLAHELFKEETSEPLAPEGYAVFQLTPDDPLPVGQLKGICTELKTLAPGEFAIPYRLDSTGSPSLKLPAGFLMEESESEIYEQAKYGIFRCMPGVCVLTGLADSTGHAIGAAAQ